MLDAELDGLDFVASSREPWLEVEGLDIRALAGAFVTITYRASLWDAPARPIWRFLRDGASSFPRRVAPAPLVATALWTGRVPAGTTNLHVSPTNRPGRFGFRVEAIRRRAWAGLLVEGYRRASRPARSAFPDPPHRVAP